MVGNFTHLLRATPSLQQACICHLCPRTTKLCGHRNEGLVLRGISPAFPPAQRPLSRPKSSARCSSSGCTCPSTWMTDSASVEQGWTRLATTDPLAHGSACETSRDPRGNLCGWHLSGSRRSGEGEPVALRIEHSGASDGPAKNRGHRAAFLSAVANSWPLTP